MAIPVLAQSVTADAAAHALPDGHGTAEAIGHQLVGLHHLPVTLLLLAAGLVLLRLLLNGADRPRGTGRNASNN